MHELEEQVIREESKSHHNFLSTCQAASYIMLCSPSRKIWLPLTIVLLRWPPPSPPSAPLTRILLAEEQPSTAASPRPVLRWVPIAKKAASFARAMGEHIYRRNFPKGLTGRTIQFQETRDSQLAHLTQTQLCRGLQLRFWHCKRSQITFLFPPLLQPGHWWHHWPLWCLQGTSRKHRPAGRSHLWDTAFMDWTRRAKAS